MAGSSRKDMRACTAKCSVVRHIAWFAFWAASYKVGVLCVYGTVSPLVNATQFLDGTLLGTFADLGKKKTISFFMPTCLCAYVPNSPSGCLSVRPHGKAGFPLDRFS
jgi:hypothetical protein